MLTEERHHLILQMLQAHQSVTVSQLCQALGASESTHPPRPQRAGPAGPAQKGARRRHADRLAVRHAGRGRLGAATASTWPKSSASARAAAQLIEPDDFVYVDGGTTTECMDALTPHRGRVCHKRHPARPKSSHRRVVACLPVPASSSSPPKRWSGRDGQQPAILQLHQGFFGTNGITRQNGFDPGCHRGGRQGRGPGPCRRAYVLADPCQAFGVIASVTFARFERATIYTTRMETLRLPVRAIFEVEVHDLYRYPEPFC